MTNALSKGLPLSISCHEYVHPWTESCFNSAAGQILHSIGNSSKIYTVVYMLSLLMRGRIPTILDLKRTFFGILQSTGFLVTNGCGYLLFVCVLRNLLGTFHYWTIAFAPAFISSFAAIIFERPTRRPLLSLYVANLATETIWRMGVARNIVQPIQYGETLIFGFSASILLYIYKRGLYKTLAKDSLFNVIKFVIGGDEEYKINNGRDIVDGNHDDDDEINIQNRNRRRRPLNNNIDSSNQNNEDDDYFDVYADANDGENEININELQEQFSEEERELHPDQASTSRRYDTNNDNDINDSGRRQSDQQPLRKSSTNAVNKFKIISEVIQIYGNFLKLIKTMPKHKSCLHSNSCTYYSICGGLKLFGVGIGLQVGLKLALQIKTILRLKFRFRKTIFNQATLKLGLFLGGFSFLYKASSCSFRHLFGKDDPLFALPAGLISSVAFLNYPDVTIALYVMWKMLQITYNMGIKRGYLPKVPGFTELLYCASTATLFHAAALEAETLRPSYWKFLSSNSGGRVNHMDRRIFDFYGLKSHQQVMNIQKLTNTDNIKIAFPL